MEQEQKDKLLKYLCAALPYGVKIAVNDGSEYWTLKGVFEAEHTGITLILVPRFPSKNVYPNTSNFPLSICKPYLRTMDSMTEDERKYLQKLPFPYDFVEGMLKLHFDFSGLIDKGLAISTDKFNPYKY